MSCPSELTCSLYCDGELPAPDARALELHLGGCLGCRARVAALGAEAALLRDVLHAPVLAPAPRRGAGPLLTCGVLLGAFALAVDTATGTLAAALPRGFGWFNPLDWIGGRFMFDAIVFAHDELGALLARCLELGTVLSLFVLLALLATALRQRATALVALALGCALLAPAPASAFEFRRDEQSVTVGAEETVSGTLVVTAEEITVNGVVDGDLIAAGGRIELRGRVTGNVYTAGGDQEIGGEIAGSLIAMGGDIEVTAAVGGNLYAAAHKLVLGAGGKVRDLAVGAGTVRIEGAVARDVFAGGRSLTFYGSVGRHVTSWSENFELGPTGSVGGDLEVHVSAEGKLEIAPEAKIGGERRELRDIELDEEPRHEWLQEHLIKPLLFGVAALLAGLVFYGLAPSLFGERVQGGADFGRSLGIGVLVLIGAPVAMVCLGITIVGIPLAAIALFAYLTALFVGWIATGALLGNAIWQAEPVDMPQFAKHLATGLLILLLVVQLPYAGGLLRLAAIVLGLGLLAASLYRSWQLRQLELE
jgi:hypothetical protein